MLRASLVVLCPLKRQSRLLRTPGPKVFVDVCAVCFPLFYMNPAGSSMPYPLSPIPSLYKYPSVAVVPPFTQGYMFGASAGTCQTTMSLDEPTRKVLITGAAGRTGALVFKKLQAKTDFQPVGLVRSQKSAAKLRKAAGATDEQIVIGDVMDSIALGKVLEGCDSLILCTSATPKILFGSILKILIKKLLRRTPGRPAFKFPPGGEPEEVDWIGAKNQIDAAVAAGVKHFVFLGSMGGTQPDNFLNSIGKREDGTGGDILLWKRKAEKYLIEKAKAQGMAYTIVHPGGLLDKPGGQQALVVDVDDVLLQRTTRSIPREDVAEVCVQALLQPKAKNVALDVIAEAVGVGVPTTDFDSLFGSLKGRSCAYESP